MKLHNNKPNIVLIDIAGQLAYNNEKVEKIKQEITGVNEVYQDEVVDMALYMSNYYLNEHEVNDETSPLQDQRDFFNDQGADIMRTYYENKLPPIHFKDDAIKNYLTVGDVRLSKYPDETPIFDSERTGNLGTYKSVDMMEIYVNKDDLANFGYDESFDSDIEPDYGRRQLTVMGITF